MATTREDIREWLKEKKVYITPEIRKEMSLLLWLVSK